jgi:hypothetical protein
MSDTTYFVCTGESAQIKIREASHKQAHGLECGRRLAQELKLLDTDEPCVMALSNDFYVGYVSKDTAAPPDGFIASKHYKTIPDHVVMIPGGRKQKAKARFEGLFGGFNAGLRQITSGLTREFWGRVGIDPSHRLVPGFLVHPVAWVLNADQGVVLVSVPDGTAYPENHPDLRKAKRWEIDKLIEEENEARAKCKEAQ